MVGAGITDLKGSKVDNTVNLRVLLKDAVQRLLVRNISFVEDRPFSANQLNTIERDLRRVVEVVDNDDIVIVLQQSQRCEGSNVAGATTSHESVRLSCAGRLLSVLWNFWRMRGSRKSEKMTP